MMSSNAVYQLRHYHLRSFLTFTGPLIVVAFYALICCGFLARPPSNDVIDRVYANARWVYFVWFFVAIFTLDWSRTGLANIEAAGLMHPKLAPKSAAQLIWHTDQKWANPTWWLRAIRVGAFNLAIRWKIIKGSPVSTPSAMWVLLSITTLLIYAALPLSGLTMEITEIQTYSDQQALIYGPSYFDFNLRSVLPVQQATRSLWQSGRATAPQNETILYAPDGTQSVSRTYFNDMAVQNADNIEFFSGPGVAERVSGTAWGMYANISCQSVPKDQLQMLKIFNFSFAVQECQVNEVGYGNCSLGMYRNATSDAVAVERANATFPFWTSGTGESGISNAFSYVVAADGYPGTGSFSNSTSSPYSKNNNYMHDNLTFDSVVHGRPAENKTVGMFEIYLWESTDPVRDVIMRGLINGTVSQAVDVLYMPNKNLTYAGIAVHCDVTTAVGHAQLNPMLRTYTAFKPYRAIANVIGAYQQILFIFQKKKTNINWDVATPQMLAASALLNGNQIVKDLNFATWINGLVTSTDEIWVALHRAVGSASDANFNLPGYNITGWTSYPALRPNDLKLAMYKLLGESVIGLMDDGGRPPWKSSLFSLSNSKYLVSGAVPWVVVLVLLSLWAFILSSGAVWTAFVAGPRWATSLDGFEMLKFGAQYTDEMNSLNKVEFRRSTQTLQRMPGMIGVLPGTGVSSRPESKLGFIGLSESPANKKAVYTMNRNEAAMTRA